MRGRDMQRKEKEKGKNFLWKSFQGCKIVSGLPWGSFTNNIRCASTCRGVPNTKQLAQKCIYSSNPDHLGIWIATVAASLLVLWGLSEPLCINGFGVSTRIVGSVLSFHLLHPGCAPVPRRSRLQLQLHKRVGFCMEWRVQGAEWGSRWREV